MHNLSHDVHAPINGIMGLADVFQENMEERDKEREMVNSIPKCSETLIEQMPYIRVMLQLCYFAT